MGWKRRQSEVAAGLCCREEVHLLIFRLLVTRDNSSLASQSYKARKFTTTGFCHGDLHLKSMCLISS